MGGCESILSIDIGTTRIKAGLVDCNTLEIAGGGSVSTPISYPRKGWSEQDPEELWKAIVQAASAALEGFEASRVSGVIFSTYLAGVVLLDRDNYELTPIITWLDERAHGLPRELFSGVLKVSGYNILHLVDLLRLTGGAPSKTGKDPLSKMVWLRENRPDLFAKAHTIGTLKTWVLAKAVGARIVSPDDAHLTWLADTRGGRAVWSPRLARRYGIPLEKLPRIASPTDAAGKLESGAARDLGLPEGIPVIVGAGDIASAAVGSGALAAGEYHIYVGTSSWIGVHSTRRLLDVRHYIGSLLSAKPGEYLVIGEQEIAGGMIDWILDATGMDYSAVEDAHSIPPGSEGLIATPWLYGERTPVDDPHAKGVIIGLTLRHTKKHLVSAAVEGVALNIAWAMEHMVRLAGKPKLVRGVGGGFRLRTLAKIIASALNTTIEIISQPEMAGVRGAGALAAASLKGSSIESEAGKIPVSWRAEADSNASRVYRDLLQVYREIYSRLKSVFRRLS
ncbi:xylulokinase [Aeropyrum camini]|uniref:Carbohydrate kinase n=1 Tax=Aeropyrum camini SY1 = JCM 12091 TaxID=1198449 RepID=U3TDN9_9CREN|nr:FGGY-family carbohydrate kinase [Aeropyrum camini]BAN89479.1 carbohydrate kinase [Aeropyrum camini SY1 = JCM 12091]